MPADVLERAVDRLGRIAAFFAGMVALELGVSVADQRLAGRYPPALEQFWDLVGATTTVAILLLLFLLIRTRALPVPALVRLALVSFVATAFLVSFADHADYFWQDGRPLHGIPWSCVVIMLLPFVVPASTGTTALVGLAMAATGPGALWVLSRLLGYQAPRAESYLEVFVPAVLTALLALIPARVIQGLGADVRQARRLGSYVLEERLGQGGMGEVWRARHRLLARQAAIKLIRPSALATRGEGVLQRFAREAQATASLRSPHTVALYDYGVSEEGSLYYAMELLDGLDLETLVRRFGPQPAARVVPWLRQACHSLREAHAAGLVHRDIKPANLFLCRYGADLDFIKVLDFGLVTLRGDSWEGDPRLTADGMVCGTPAYMAPELASGGHPVDGRADIYALGCVAYWLLTGRPVFEGRSPVEVIAGHLERTPMPPSRVSPASIPESLEVLLLSCLAKSPSDRPRSVEEVRYHLDEVPVDVSWSQERAAEWWRTHLPQATTKPRSPAPGHAGVGSEVSRSGSLPSEGPPGRPSGARSDP